MLLSDVLAQLSELANFAGEFELESLISSLFEGNPDERMLQNKTAQLLECLEFAGEYENHAVISRAFDSIFEAF